MEHGVTITVTRSESETFQDDTKNHWRKNIPSQKWKERLPFTIPLMNSRLKPPIVTATDCHSAKNRKKTPLDG